MAHLHANPDLTGLTIGLAGPFPPHRGGVTVYVQRLAARLQQSGARVVAMVTNPTGSEVPAGLTVTRPRGGPWQAADCISAALRERADVLHLHTHGGFWKEMAPFAAMQALSGVPVVVSQHSMMQDPAAMRRRDRAMLARVCNQLARVATAGPTVYAKLRQVGVRAEKLAQIVPFIAPMAAELVCDDLPPALQAWRASSGPRIVSATGRLDAVDGRDLYGLDVFVRAAELVLRHLPTAQFAFLMGTPGDAALLADAEQFVADHGLGDRVALPVWAMPAPPLWQAADICVRPTLDDGDAVSIREALHLGKPVVASDAVPRPAGCVTFRRGDAADLARALLAVAADLPSHRQRVAACQQPDTLADLTAVYRQAVADRSVLQRVRGAAARQAAQLAAAVHKA